MVGEEGPPPVHVLGVDMPKVIDEARGGIEKEALGDDAREGTLEGGNCRIRRKPDAPNPTS